MAEPASDHREVNTCRHKVHCRRMTEAVRRYPFRGHAWHGLGCRLDVFRQFEAGARCAEWDAIPINEDRLVVSPRLPLELRSDQRYRLWPKRAQPFFSPLAVKTHAGWRGEPDCPRANIERFLDARASIVEEGEQRVVALPFDRRAIGLGQNGLHLLRLQIARRVDRCFLHGNVQNLGALLDGRGLAVSNEAEEAAQMRTGGSCACRSYLLVPAPCIV